MATFRCKGCGMKLDLRWGRDAAQVLGQHLPSNKECWQYYVDAGYTSVYAGREIITDTLGVWRLEQGFQITAVDTVGRSVELSEIGRLSHLIEELGGVEDAACV